MWGPAPDGPLAVPGTYSVTLAKRVGGQLTRLAGPVSFEVVPLGLATLPAADRGKLLAFQRKLGRLQRAALGASGALEDAIGELALVKRATLDTPGIDPALIERARGLEQRLLDLRETLHGDATRSSRQESVPPSILARVGRATEAVWTTSSPTGTQRRVYEIAAGEFEPFLAELRRAVETDLAALEEALEGAGAPWTPGRGVPRWKP